jgi:prepilin-type N-terminal cleavage/methylation domain-containing protein/prepilin-type processing-associated H-X9-DG protein
MHHDRKKAFTLVELLVVIAIVAMLISLVLPGLAKSRALARSTKCKANLRQQTLALASYTNDYKGLGPHERGVNFNYDPNAIAANAWSNGGSAARWMKKLCLYLGATSTTQFTTQVWSYDTYTPDKLLPVFQCPETFPPLPVLSGSGRSYGLNIFIGTDFTSGNIMLGAPTAAASPINLHRGLAAMRLSELTAIADSCYYNNHGLTHGTGLWTAPWAHNMRINIALADGHVVDAAKNENFIYLKFYRNNGTFFTETFN